MDTATATNTAPASAATSSSHESAPAILIDPANFDRADTQVFSQPFCFLVMHNQLPDAAKAEIAADYPHVTGAGYLPHEPSECGPSVNRLIAQLTSRAVADAVGARLGIPNLGDYPTMAMTCRYMNKRHGTIHTDGRSKLVTMLLYLNETWPDTSDGCLRFLSKIDDIDAMLAPEVRPLYGTIIAFKRADNSFHGHLPYGGERRVIQITWLVNEDEKQRKLQRGKLSRMFKKIFGGLDSKLGAGRDRNAAHRA